MTTGITHTMHIKTTPPARPNAPHGATKRRALRRTRRTAGTPAFSARGAARRRCPRNLPVNASAEHHEQGRRVRLQDYLAAARLYFMRAAGSRRSAGRARIGRLSDATTPRVVDAFYETKRPRRVDGAQRRREPLDHGGARRQATRRIRSLAMRPVTRSTESTDDRCP